MTYSRPHFARQTLIVAALAMTALPAAAQAATKVEISARSNGERITVTVPMDIMETQDGVERIYAALQRKAEKSCKITIPMRIGRSVSVGICTRKLMNGFVDDLDHDGMTALHEENA